MTSDDAGTKPKALDAKGVRKVVAAALSNQGYYIESFSFHSRFDHPERHLSIDDIIFGLKKEWRACKVDGFNDDEWQWKYRIKTHDIDGHKLIVVVGLDTKNIRFTVVTTFYDD
jgi:hypothetical protein